MNTASTATTAPATIVPTTAPGPTDQQMYDALARRDEEWVGVFFVGVKTTGILCRPGCPARTPKFENVEFFRKASDGLFAGYRPCRRCHPLEPTGGSPEWLQPLLDAVDADPTRRWRDQNLRDRDLDPARVRRWFQKHHRMTFHAFARARRLGAALGQLREGGDATMTAFDHGYESLSGFRGAFENLFGEPPGRGRNRKVLTVTRIPTPLGPMLAAASDEHLLLLEFADRRMLATQITRLRSLTGCGWVPGSNDITAMITDELTTYFAGDLREFSVPWQAPGTEFQREVWDGLGRIPYAETCSYADLAHDIDRAAAVRAVGRANGDNRLAIIIPCHRVIGANGKLTGYGGHVWRKQALLDLERGARTFDWPTP